MKAEKGVKGQGKKSRADRPGFLAVAAAQPEEIQVTKYVRTLCQNHPGVGSRKRGSLRPPPRTGSGGLNPIAEFGWIYKTKVFRTSFS